MKSQNDKAQVILQRLSSFFRQAPLQTVVSLLSVGIGLWALLLVTFVPASQISRLLMTRVSSKTMGSDLTAVVAKAPTVFQDALLQIINTTALPPMVEANGSHALGGFLAGLSALLIPAIFIAVFMSAFYRAGARIVHQLRDDS